jgi:predicted nucleic acid-binding protein
VTDANLWIDLLCAEIEARVFCLDWEFIAPDVVLAEVLLPYSWRLQGLGLVEMELSGVSMQKAEELIRRYPRPGRRDILSLVLAMQEKAILLTGDEALRKAASGEDVVVHGTLWLLDAMVREEAISREEGCRSLEGMLASGRRLPKNEVSARIAAWSRI